VVENGRAHSDVRANGLGAVGGYEDALANRGRREHEVKPLFAASHGDAHGWLEDEARSVDGQRVLAAVQAFDTIVTARTARDHPPLGRAFRDHRDVGKGDAVARANDAFEGAAAVRKGRSSRRCDHEKGGDRRAGEEGTTDGR
jgi:hypothetical protein